MVYGRPEKYVTLPETCIVMSPVQSFNARMFNASKRYILSNELLIVYALETFYLLQTSWRAVKVVFISLKLHTTSK